MDKLNTPPDTFRPLRFLCNWCAHIDIKSGYAQDIFNVLHKGLHATFLRQNAKPFASEMKYALSLLEARDSFLEFLRQRKLIRARLFESTEWAAFLKYYLRVVSDCPVILNRRLDPCYHIIDVRLSGYEPEPLVDGNRVHVMQGVRWTFRFVGGLEFPFDFPLLFTDSPVCVYEICKTKGFGHPPMPMEP